MTTEPPGVAALLSAYAEAEDERVRIVKRQREIEDQIDALRLAAKPTYPTEDHMLGIEAAVRMISDQHRPPSHHGCRAGSSNTVYVHGESGWVRVISGAPYTRRGYGERLWRFTDEEAEMFVGMLEAAGLRVDQWWHADGGISFNTTLKSDILDFGETSP